MPSPTKPSSTALIDWHVLAKVVEYSLLLGVGLTVLVAVAVTCSHFASTAKQAVAVRAAAWLGTVVSLATIAAAIWWGLLMITKKS